MAVDLEAIRRRMAELSGVKKTSSVQMWKPGVGEHKVRCLPWSDTPDGQPFKERWFYYIGTNAGILSPKQFGKPDPIDDLLRKLYSTKSEADRAIAKQLQPKMRAYVPVIVRGQEDKGPQIWSFGKLIYQRLLGFFLDEDYGNILDPNEGFDLKVTITQSPGKQFQDTVVDCKGRPTKLHDDPAVMKKWIDSIPNLDDMYRLKPKEEIEAIVTAWLNGDSAPPSPADDMGTSRGKPVKGEIDDIVSDVKASKPKKALVEDDESPAPRKQSLDEAFADLMGDD